MHLTVLCFTVNGNVFKINGEGTGRKLAGFFFFFLLFIDFSSKFYIIQTISSEIIQNCITKLYFPGRSVCVFIQENILFLCNSV